MSWRRTGAVLVLIAVAAAVAVLLATGSSSTSSRSSLTLGHFNAVHEGSGSSQGEGGEAAAEAYTDRAYPAAGVSIDQIQTAIGADAAIQNRNVADSTNTWDFLGPNTLNVDRLGTQAFLQPTQWSGRVTAVAIDPKCRPTQCRIYVAAAGGGVWRSTNATAAAPLWQNVSAGIPTNAIGSIAVDPNDPALFDGERQATVLERQCCIAEQFAAPAVQGGDIGVVAAGDLFEVVDGGDYLAGYRVALGCHAQQHFEEFDDGGAIGIAAWLFDLR